MYENIYPHKKDDKVHNGLYIKKNVKDACGSAIGTAFFEKTKKVKNLCNDIEFYANEYLNYSVDIFKLVNDKFFIPCKEIISK